MNMSSPTNNPAGSPSAKSHNSPTPKQVSSPANRSATASSAHQQHVYSPPAHLNGRTKETAAPSLKFCREALSTNPDISQHVSYVVDTVFNSPRYVRCQYWEAHGYAAQSMMVMDGQDYEEMTSTGWASRAPKNVKPGGEAFGEQMNEANDVKMKWQKEFDAWNNGEDDDEADGAGDMAA